MSFRARIRVMLPVHSTEEQAPGDAVCGSPHVSPRSDLSLAESLPSALEVSRMGETYRCCATAAVASVVAVPTTAAQLTLWNGEPDDGKVYVLEAAHTVAVAGAVAGPITIVGCVNAGKKANPAGTLLTIRGTAGQQYLGQGVVALARSITNDGWFPLMQARAHAASAIGAGAYVDLRGSVVLKPGHMFSISVVTNSTGITVRSGLRWQEVYLPAYG